jgi:hypothetical protein
MRPIQLAFPLCIVLKDIFSLWFHVPFPLCIVLKDFIFFDFMYNLFTSYTISTSDYIKKGLKIINSDNLDSIHVVQDKNQFLFYVN